MASGMSLNSSLNQTQAHPYLEFLTGQRHMHSLMADWLICSQNKLGQRSIPGSRYYLYVTIWVPEPLDSVLSNQGQTFIIFCKNSAENENKRDNQTLMGNWIHVLSPHKIWSLCFLSLVKRSHTFYMFYRNTFNGMQILGLSIIMLPDCPINNKNSNFSGQEEEWDWEEWTGHI